LRVHRTFWFALLLVACGLGQRPLVDIPVVYLQLALVTLVRELGHALALEGFGVRPRTILFWQGGYTTYYARALPFGRAVVAELAGPAAVLGLGLAAEALGCTRLAILARGWGVISLLPILPLPGGQIVLRVIRSRWLARAISVVAALGCGIMVVGEGNQYPILLLVFGVAIVENLKRQQAGQTAADHAWQHYRAGNLDAAEAWVRHFSPSELDPVLEGAIDLERGRLARAIDHFRDAFDGAPTDNHAAWLATGLIRHQRLDDATRLLDEEVAGPELFRVMMAALFYAQRFPEAARVGERSWAAEPDPETAYNLACTRARMDEPEVAMSWLSRALDAGWRDLKDLDEDDDLASLRTRPDWAPLRARLTSLGRT
jgi:hypothetical protein